MAEMDVSSLKPNSHKYKAEKAKEKTHKPPGPIVTKDKIVSTKKTFGRKIADAFLSEDIQNIKTWIWEDVIVPGTQRTILNIISMMFSGETVDERKDSYRSGRRANHTDYRSQYRNSSDRRGRQSDRYEADDHVDFRHIVLRERSDAEVVIDHLRDRIEDTGSVSIADLLDMVDATSRYTDNNWGWKDRRDIGIRRVSNGFLIDVTEPIYLD